MLSNLKIGRRSDRLACLMLCQGAVYRRAVERQAWLLMVCEYPYEAQVLAFQTLPRADEKAPLVMEADTSRRSQVPPTTQVGMIVGLN